MIASLHPQLLVSASYFLLAHCKYASSYPPPQKIYRRRCSAKHMRVETPIIKPPDFMGDTLLRIHSIVCVIDCNGLFTVARQRLLCSKEDILHNRVLQGGIERPVHRVGGNLTEKHQACLGEIWPIAALCRRYLVWKRQYTWDCLRCSTYTIRQRGEIICKSLRQSNRYFTINGGFTLLINFVNHIQLLDKRGLPKC